MIPLTIPAKSDAAAPFVTRLRSQPSADKSDSWLVNAEQHKNLWCGQNGLMEIAIEPKVIMGDVLFVDPIKQRAERLVRAGSSHNTLLITEQCDQLCVMCSQPPKKSHVDRFDAFEEACKLAENGSTIGISGGEPTLHMEKLLNMLESVLLARPDLSFHVLSNAQHFEREHIQRLRGAIFKKVVWGIPIYSSIPAVHDQTVGKTEAFDRLLKSFEVLLLAGARIELRTVLTNQTVKTLEALAKYVSINLNHVEQWSLMGLENVGFAKNNWSQLYFDVLENFRPIGTALDIATLKGVQARLFNIPLCHVPEPFRHFAVASISDWKQKFAEECNLCSLKIECGGFFEWHPTMALKVIPE